MELVHKEKREIDGINALILDTKHTTGDLPKNQRVIAYDAESGFVNICAVYPAAIDPQEKADVIRAMDIMFKFRPR